MHYEWDELAISDLERMNLQAHRESGKSTFWAIAYPIYRIALWLWAGNQGKPEIDEHIGIYCVNQDEASARLRQVKRELETNQLLRADFGPYGPGEEWTESSLSLNRAVDQKNPNVFASSLLNATPGVRTTAAIIDDSTDPLSAHSKLYRDKQTRVLEEVIEPNLLEGAPLIGIHTQYHNDDFPNRLTRRKDFYSKKWPLVPEPYTDNVEHRICNWPEAWPWTRVEMAMKKPLIWTRQYQLRVVLEEDRLLPEPKYYDPRTLEYRDSAWRIKGELVRMAIGVDPASTEGELNRGSRTAIVVVAITSQMEKYVTEIRVGRWAPQRVMEEIVDMWRKWQAAQVFIEEVNFSKIYGDLLRRNTGCPAKASAAQGDKVQRIAGTLNPEMENGKLFFLEVGMEEIIREIAEFPGDTMDIPDALEHVVRNVNTSPVFAAANSGRVINGRRMVGGGGSWVNPNYND